MDAPTRASTVGNKLRCLDPGIIAL
jgi:hypothetical protein